MSTERKPDVGNLSLVVIDGPKGRVHEKAKRDPQGRDWPHIAYTVAVVEGPPDSNPDQRRVIWSGPFNLGVGHVKPRAIGPSFTHSIPGDIERKERAQYLSEAWARQSHAQFCDVTLWADVAATLAKLQKVKPNIHDVLYSILTDGRAFFDAESFEEWCDNFGYDTDSIQAHKTYLICLETGRQLTQRLGAQEIERLRTEFQDY